MFFRKKLISAWVLAVSLKLGWISHARAVVVNLPAGEEADLKKIRVALDHRHTGENDQPGAHSESAGVDLKGFPFWEHVGMVGMGSGIYLGDGYILTGAHVGCFPFRFSDGDCYKPDYASWRVLEDGSGNRSDVAVFRVKFAADSRLARLGRLPIASSVPENQERLLMVGAGLSQQPEPSTLKCNGKVLSVLGYRLESRRAMTWGLNSRGDILVEPVETGAYRTHCFVTRFDRAAFEAQAADGDSGGASFRYNAEKECWELAGCIIGVTQKGAYVPFGSRTFIADLSRYRDQLLFDEQESKGSAQTIAMVNTAAVEASGTGVRPAASGDEGKVRPASIAASAAASD